MLKRIPIKKRNENFDNLPAVAKFYIQLQNESTNYNKFLLAVKKNIPEVIQFYLVNNIIQTERLSLKENGQILRAALDTKNLVLIKLLLDAGINPNSALFSFRTTALHLLFHEYCNFLKLNDGIHNTKCEGAISVIALFLNAGANPEIEDSYHQTALDVITTQAPLDLLNKESFIENLFERARNIDLSGLQNIIVPPIEPEELLTEEVKEQMNAYLALEYNKSIEEKEIEALNKRVRTLSTIIEEEEKVTSSKDMPLIVSNTSSVMEIVNTSASSTASSFFGASDVARKPFKSVRFKLESDTKRQRLGGEFEDSKDAEEKSDASESTRCLSR